MRKLTADERRLWDFVTRSVTPLRPRHADQSEPPPAAPEQRPRQHAAPLAQDTASIHRPAYQAPLRVGHAADLDAATARKFKRGKMPCDARLDLHGLTLAQAHATLSSFVAAQAGRGARCVLVITGKGKPDDSERPRGRIKTELIHWLNSAPLRAHILAVTEAGPRQGGAGAAYILLKRRRTAA